MEYQRSCCGGQSTNFYSVGHLCIPGGNTRKPSPKYLIAYNKITKDRYLPTGPELTQSAQLFDISGEKNADDP
jgi:nitrous-oxide reductase